MAEFQEKPRRVRFDIFVVDADEIKERALAEAKAILKTSVISGSSAVLACDASIYRPCVVIFAGDRHALTIWPPSLFAGDTLTVTI